MSHVNTLMDSMWEHHADLRTKDGTANMIAVGAEWLKIQGYGDERALEASKCCVEGTVTIAAAERVYTGIAASAKKGAFTEHEINSMIIESQNFNETMERDIWEIQKNNAVRWMKEGAPKAKIWESLQNMITLGYHNAEHEVAKIVEILKNTPHGKTTI